MQPARADQKDPMVWCKLGTIAFLALVCIRLAVVPYPYFDEVHYLPAARELLVLGEFTNREHPLFGKMILAASIALFGDNPLGWRGPSALAGAFALFAAMRALWFAIFSRAATLTYGVLLATGGLLFVHARIAMLEAFMLAFLALAFWQAAAAMREPETARRRLAVTGVALGLAMGAKWNALVLAPVFGLAFLVMRMRAGRRRLLWSRRGAPVPGMTLVEAGLWLGVLPLAVYAATFLPAYFYASGAIGAEGLVAHHVTMFELQSSLKTPHNYQSVWWQWALNVRGIWYLYEPVEGVQRGVLLIGNPVTMLLGLAAVAWCGWRGLAKPDAIAGAVAGLYALTLGFWAVAAKPVQFYYHYLLPSMFLLAALALALAHLWESGRRWAVAAVLTSSAIAFAWLWPIYSAAALADERAFQRWAILEGWR